MSRKALHADLELLSLKSVFLPRLPLWCDGREVHTKQQKRRRCRDGKDDAKQTLMVQVSGCQATPPLGVRGEVA
jgi:hypothetical protein